MQDKKRIAIIALSAISVIFLITGGYLWIALRNSEAYNVEIQELMALEKEEMLNDLTSAQVQYDELMVRINNDSLKFKLEREQIRTKQLLEELGYEAFGIHGCGNYADCHCRDNDVQGYPSVGNTERVCRDCQALQYCKERFLCQWSPRYHIKETEGERCH